MSQCLDEFHGFVGSLIFLFGESAFVCFHRWNRRVDHHGGTPNEILTDNGKQYVNELSTYLYDLMYTDHITVLPYSHQENSVVERANKEVNKHLRAIIFDRKIKTNWSLVLPLVQRVMNTFVHSSIGCAPAQIIFGNALDLDRRILHSPPPDDEFTNTTYPEYVYKLLNLQAEVIASEFESVEKLTLEYNSSYIPLVLGPTTLVLFELFETFAIIFVILSRVPDRVFCCCCCCCCWNLPYVFIYRRNT